MAFTTAVVFVCATAGARELSDAEIRQTFVKMPVPTYPYEALRARHEGSGVFRLYIREDGKVVAVKPLKGTGHGELDDAAVEGFTRWRAKVGSRREVDLPVNFTLDGRRRPELPRPNDGLGLQGQRDR